MTDTDATKLPEHIEYDPANFTPTYTRMVRLVSEACRPRIYIDQWTADDLRAIAAHMDAQAGRGEGDYMQAVMAELPVGYIPNHTPANAAAMVGEWVRRAVAAENELLDYAALAANQPAKGESHE